LGPTTTQLNEGGLVLNPQPGDRTGDELDGKIVVRRRAERSDDIFQDLGRVDETRRDLIRLLSKLVGLGKDVGPRR
jgi:hypothetical protein